MKVNDPNLAGLGGLNPVSTGKTARAGRTAPARESAAVAPQGDAADGVQLSGLAQKLQSLAADSPDRDARVEQLARAYAQGTYQVDPQQTASGVIDDALRYSKDS